MTRCFHRLILCGLLLGVGACQRGGQDHVLNQNFDHPCDFYQAAADFALDRHVVWGPDDFQHVHDRLASSLATQHETSVDSSDTVCQQLQDIYTHSQSENQNEKQWYMTQVKAFYQLLDPHSNYLTPEEFTQYEKRSYNQKKSTGIDFFYRHRAIREETTDFAWTVDFIDPKAQIQGVLAPGDTMVAIDSQPIVGLDFKNIQKLFFQAPEGLYMQTDRGQDVFAPFVEAEFSMVQVKLLPADPQQTQWLWLRLDHFGRGVGQQTLAALHQYREQVEGYVLDLRGNPGGFLSELQPIADFFLDAGSTYEEIHLRKQKVVKHRVANPAQTDSPVIVLVDSHTASLAEIFAGQMQNRQRGLIVGSPTFGKATAQSVYAVSPDHGYGGAIKVTEHALTYDQIHTHQYHGIEPDWAWEDPSWQKAIATYQGILYEKQAPMALELKKEPLPRQTDLVDQLSLGQAQTADCASTQFRSCYHQQINQVLQTMRDYQSSWLP
jgi:C-terminal peptidase prc